MPRSLLWPDPRVKPPFGAAEVDWSHPLARGLAFLSIFNESGSGVVDLVTKLGGSPVNAPFVTPSADGLGVDLSTNGYYKFPISSDAAFTGDISLVWRGLIRTGSNYRQFMQK